MKKILSLISLIVFATTLWAQMPDAEYNLIRQQWRVNEDGTIDYNYRKELKFIRNRSFTAYADKGETFIVYNPDFETLTINESYTIRADGSRVQTPQNAFIEQLPSSCENCGRYNNLRELAIVHTALEYNCVVVLDYTIHRNSHILKEEIMPQQDCPVKRYEIIVDVPKTQQFKATYNDPIMPVQWTLANDTHTYHFVAFDMPQYAVDAVQPSSNALYTQITLSNGIPTPLPHLHKVDGANETLRVLTKSDSLETVESIRQFVMDNIHTNNINFRNTNYKRSLPETTWNSGCGTYEDKEALLCALLRQAGFKSEIIGDHNVTVVVGGIEYIMSIAYKDPIAPYGVAKDMEQNITIEKELPLDTTAIADGYYKVTLPNVVNPFKNAKYLTTKRYGAITNIKHTETNKYTITLPKGAKLIGGKIDVNKTIDSVGSVEIVIKQKGNSLKIYRHLEIIPDTITTGADGKSKDLYSGYRALMQLWCSYDELFIKL